MLNERIASLSLESEKLNSSLLPSDSSRIISLVKAVNKYEEDLSFPDSINLNIEFLENYIRGYYVLIPNGFNIYKVLKSATETISGTFGIKPVVSTVLPDKNIEVTAIKKKKIKTHLNNESRKLHKNLKALKDYIDLKMIPEIDRIDNRAKSNFEKLFHGTDVSMTSVEYYFNYNNVVIKYFQKLIITRNLATTISESLDQIMKSEKDVKNMIASRQKIKKDSYKLHKLLNEIHKMNNLLKQSEL